MTGSYFSSLSSLWRDPSNITQQANKEGSPQAPVYRRLGAGHLAQPEPSPFIPWSTSLLGSLAEPMIDGPLESYQVGSQTAEPSFFDGVDHQHITFVWPETTHLDTLQFSKPLAVRFFMLHSVSSMISRDSFSFSKVLLVYDPITENRGKLAMSDGLGYRSGLVQTINHT